MDVLPCHVIFRLVSSCYSLEADLYLHYSHITPYFDQNVVKIKRSNITHLLPSSEFGVVAICCKKKNRTNFKITSL